MTLASVCVMVPPRLSAGSWEGAARGGAARGDAGAWTPRVSEEGRGDGAQEDAAVLQGAVGLPQGVVSMQFVCTVYVQLLIMPSLVWWGQIYLFSVLFNTQVTTAGAFNEFFKKIHCEPHILAYLRLYFTHLMDSSLCSGS